MDEPEQGSVPSRGAGGSEPAAGKPLLHRHGRAARPVGPFGRRSQLGPNGPYAAKIANRNPLPQMLPPRELVREGAQRGRCGEIREC